jgi:glutamate-1-semialdehyde 2,1-aminomutase
MTAADRKGNKSEKALIGGGTFSAHPCTAAAGLAMIHYLKDHAHEVYPLLEARGEKVRKGVQEAMRRNGIPCHVTGVGSLFQTHFPQKEGVILNSPQGLSEFTDTEKREVEFKVRMLTKGVHVVHGGGAVSLAHSDTDIQKTIEAAGEVAKDMARERK